MKATIGMTNEEIVERWLQHVSNQQGRRPHTIHTYTDVIGHWLEWLDGRPLAEVTPYDVEDFSQRPRRSGQRGAAATCRKDVTVVRRLHAWASERGLPAAPVSTAVAPSVGDRDPKPVDDDDWLRLWHSDLRDEDRVILGVMYFIGLRRIEAAGLRPNEVDVDLKQIRTLRKGGSTRAIEYGAIVDALTYVPNQGIPLGGQEWVPLLEGEVKRRVALGATYLWWESSDDWRNDPLKINKRLRVLLTRAGMDPSSFTPHQLRHSAATNLLRAGVPIEFIADQMSHSSTTMTLRYANTSGQLARWLDSRRKA